MKNLQVNLLFQADTSAATRNIQQLGQLLNTIATNTKIGVDSGSLSQAASAAQQLSAHLQVALNQNTGKLDLSKLNASLKQSGTDLQILTTQLQAAGPAGQQAFIKIATAIASAEAPMFRLNKKLKDFGVTLANTVKWQIASTAIHGIQGMLTSAVSHAEDLNKALNDIQIVTGRSNSQMAEFASQASIAAKELSTTSTEFAKAALIFYQQGLDGDAVMDRANVVVKLSQVTGQSAQEVSNQMTAIWNNFDDGTKSLEYFADALTKLGAATAASTDEIAAGLEKFAAIAETVGLSYEYAAASVATVVDRTRQSAEVVGTAFKTIFARMQGLSLGETLEDGVDLNKYSAALESVGVKVLDANGNMRDMDKILEDLGGKWVALGETTQTALAQTVGGARQYNQMVSLMSNWDLVKENIELAKQSTGELTQQHQIWSTSYEAASNRVKQAQNELYENFIDDKSIVKLNDAFALLITTVGKAIESLGGLGPMALTIGAVFANKLFPMLLTGFNNLKANIAVITGQATKDLVFMQNSMRIQMQDTMNNAGFSESLKQQIALSENLLVAKQKLTQASKNMSAAALEEAQRRMQIYEALVAETQQSLQRQIELEREIELERQQLTSGSSKRTIQQQGGLHTFEKKHTDMSQEEIDNIFTQATTQSQSVVKQKLKEYDELMAKSDSLTSEEEEKLKVLKAQLDQLKLIKEMQDNIAAARNKPAENVAVATVEDSTDYMQQDYGKDMVEGLFKDGGALAGQGAVSDGGIQVEASLNNLEILYTKMGEYKNYAQQMDSAQKDLSNSLMSTNANGDTQLIANADALKASVGAMGDYEKATQAVADKQKEYDDAVRAATEAMQKSQKAGKNDIKAKEELKKANEAVAQKQKELIRAQSDQDKAFKKGTVSGENYVKQLSSMKTNLLNVAQAADSSGKTTRQINEAFDQIGNGQAEQGLTKLKEIMTQLNLGSSEAAGGVEGLAAAMQTALGSAGLDPAKLQSFVNHLLELGVISPEVANQLRLLGAEGANLGPKMSSGAQAAVAGLGAIATAAGKITMAVNGVRSLANAFKEGASPIERFTGITMGLSTLLPALAGAITLVNGVKQVNTLITGGATAATLLQMAAEGKLILSEGALTAVLWAKNVALAVGKALAGDYGAIILAVAAAAAIAAIAIGSQAKAEQDLIDSQKLAVEGSKEQVSQINELVSAWQEQTGVMDALIQKYRELKDAEEDYKGVTQDIQGNIPEMVKYYQDLLKALNLPKDQRETVLGLIDDLNAATAAGNIDQINEYSNQIDAIFSAATKKEYEKALNDSMYDIVETMIENGDNSAEIKTVNGEQHFVRNVWGAANRTGSYTYEDGTAVQYTNKQGNVLNASNEENAAVAVLQKFGLYESSFGTGSSHGATIGLSMASPEEFLADYQAADQALTEMREVLGDQLDNSDVYREFNEMMSGTKDAYDEMLKLSEQANELGFADKKAQMALEGNDISDIQSYSDYLEYKNKLLEGYEEGSEEYAAGEQWLNAHAITSQYKKYDDAIRYLENETDDDYTDFVKNLSPEDQELFLEVNVDKMQSETAIKAEIERLRGIAAEEEIQTKITGVKTAQDTLKEDGMTQEDWTKMKDETLDWGKDGIIAFNEFLSMTYEQQSQYLQNQSLAYYRHLEEVQTNTLNQLKGTLATAGSTLSPEERAALQEEIALLEEKLLITGKIIEDEKESAQRTSFENQGFDYDEIKEYAEILDDIVETTAELDDRLDDNQERLLNFARSVKQTERGIKKLNDGLKDWKAALMGKDTIKAAKAWTELEDALADVMNITDELSEAGMSLGDHFKKYVLENMDKVEKAAQGDREAILDLQKVAAEDMIIGLELDPAKEKGALAQVSSIFDQMQSMLDTQDLKVGTPIMETGPLLGQLESLINSLGVGVGEAQAILAGLGFDAEVVEGEPVHDTVTRTFSGVRATPGWLGFPEPEIWQETTTDTVEGTVGNALKITSGEYVGGGNIGGSSGSTDTGGGGGGSPKKITKKNYRYDGERYHYLNNQLEDLEAEYDAVSDAADRAFGADKLKLMDAQIEKTKELKQQNEDYIKALQENRGIDREVMKAQYANLLGDSALQFDIDEKGEIRNFDKIQESMIKDYNAKAALYEAGDMSETDWEAYEKLYEQVEKDIEMYEQSEDDLRDALARRKELEYQEINEKLAKIEYAAEVKLEISQDELDVIEYQLELLDDKAFSSADKIAQNVTKASNLVEQMETTQQAMDDILSASNISDSDIATLLDPKTTEKQMEAILKGKNITEDQVNSIRNYRDSLLDMNRDLIEVRNTIREEVTNAFEEWNEELDKGISKFDHYNSVLESYQNIIGIVGKDALGISDEMMAEMSATKVENSINQLNSMREKYESISKARDDALAKSKDMTLTEEDRKYWAEQYETMNESAQEAQEELMSTWESTLEGIVAQFEESVQRAVDAFNKAIYDGGLEGLSEDFEWEQEKDDMYLDDYQKIYELSKMTRDINKTMDDTKSIAGKQKLKGLIEDINKLQEEGVEMSEYDLEYLQAEYDLRLAEIALEDAQRAKDTVRLSRDSEGNFSYVYTQNTDAVDEAQQKYEDALYSMQDLSSNYIDEMSAQLIETSQAMQEELAALRVEDYASIEEYYAAVAEVESKYQDKLSRQEAELQKAIGNNKELYEQDWANYAAATGYKISATEDFVTAWGDTTLANMMGLDDATSFTDVIGGAADALVNGLLEAANTYYNNVDAANEAAGTSTGAFAEMLQENIEAIQTESTAAAESVQKMADSMDTAMQKIMDQTALWQQEHSKNIEKIIADNVKAAESYNGLLEYLSNNAVGNYEVLIRGASAGGGEGAPASMDTGGYTGNWGTSGKLALLHEKELVLNKDDTANMLRLVEMTRQMIAVIDTKAQQLSQGLGTPVAASLPENREDILEQFVEIKADFPNVSNHTEIEEALGNLINTASQYANRRKS